MGGVLPRPERLGELKVAPVQFEFGRYITQTKHMKTTLRSHEPVIAEFIRLQELYRDGKIEKRNQI